MLPDIKGYARLTTAEKAAKKIRGLARQGWAIGEETTDVKIRIIRRTWSDNRFVVVVCCESTTALQFGVGLAHTLPNVYVTNQEWIEKETAGLNLSPMQAALLCKELIIISY